MRRHLKHHLVYPIALLSVLLGQARPAQAAFGAILPDAVYQGQRLAPFLAAADVRRVDVAGIGDSNQIFGTLGRQTQGWSAGYHEALGERFALYATGLMGQTSFGTTPDVGYVGAAGARSEWPA